MTAVLDQEQRAWLLEAATSITVASSDGSGAPAVAQGIGLRLEDDGRRIRIFMVEARSRAVVASLREGRPIAIVFTHAPTLRSLQIKAPKATEVAVDDGDRQHIHASVDAVVRSWTHAPEAVVRTLLATGPEPIVGFELEPNAAFDQTPGPKAGAALPGGVR